MKTQEIIDLGFIICFVAAGFAFVTAIGYLIRRIKYEEEERIEREIKEKHKRIVDADDLLNEMEVGLEWGKND